MTYAIRGSNRTFQVLFVRGSTGIAVSVTNPTITIFHYDDIDGITGNNKIIDVYNATLIPDSDIGQYHYVWYVPSSKLINQMHYTIFKGFDPSTNLNIVLEESFSIVDGNTSSNGLIRNMTSSFIKY
jgi:hypothetical protein